MYSFITFSKNTNKLWMTPMYIFKNIQDNNYYISLTYPKYSVFNGIEVRDITLYPKIDYPQLITENDIKNNKVRYMNQDWLFQIKPLRTCLLY